MRHVNDELLKSAVASYLSQIEKAAKAQGDNIAVMIVLGRPAGEEFKVFLGASVDGKPMAKAVQRRVLKALHNATGIVG